MPITRVILFCLALTSHVVFSQNEVVVPNIITPNGDQINDVFSIRVTGYDELSCTIFNRYGQTVYRYFGVNGTWDGYTHAGVKVSAGTYFVFVELMTEDGSVETRHGTLQVQY